MNELTTALRRVVEALDAVHADYVVVGSTAAAAWGVVRATRDVVAVVAPGAAEDLVRALEREELYVPVDEARSAIRDGGVINVLHPSTGGKVDVFVRSDAFPHERIARRVATEVLGVPTWIATAEDVVLAKLRWRLDTRSEVQWRDCVEIAATQRLDRDYLRAWADRLGVADDVADLLDAIPPT